MRCFTKNFTILKKNHCNRIWAVIYQLNMEKSFPNGLKLICMSKLLMILHCLCNHLIKSIDRNHHTEAEAMKKDFCLHNPFVSRDLKWIEMLSFDLHLLYCFVPSCMPFFYLFFDIIIIPNTMFNAPRSIFVFLRIQSHSSRTL